MIIPVDNIFGVEPYLQRQRNTNCMNDQVYAILPYSEYLTNNSGACCFGNGFINITYEKIEARGGSGGLATHFLGLGVPR